MCNGVSVEWPDVVDVVEHVFEGKRDGRRLAAEHVDVRDELGMLRDLFKLSKRSFSQVV